MSKRQPDWIRRRIEMVAGILALGIALLAIRAIDLQWLQHEKLTAVAEKQRYRQFAAVAPRGSITDTHGRILAESIEVPSIAAMADEVPTERIPMLADALKMDRQALLLKLKGRDGFVWLARQVQPEVAQKVMRLGIPGVREEKEWRRYYPLGPETGHLLGFVGIDGHGLEGIEHTLDSHLAGVPGVRQVQRDARGRSLPGGIWLRQPKPGKPIRLTIDATIQSIAYAALTEEVLAQQAKGGSVVIMRPNDGAILAMVNWPGFNPNNFASFKPWQWRNRAITDVFEPGSALKPFTLAAAMSTGRWRPDSIVFCEQGAMRVADHVIHDDHPEGWLDLSGVIAKSSNIGAAKLALDIGAEQLHRTLRKLGFGQKTSIGILGESPGIMPPIERWGPVETANIAFGQGIAVTPLQLATAFSVLARGGIYLKPYILEGMTDSNPRQVIAEPIAGTLLHMLERATSSEGTGHLAVPAGYLIAGKTGTAQKPLPEGGYAKDKFTAVFAGIAPANHPQLVMVVVVDEPQKQIYGGQAAAPVFRRIAENVLPYLGIPPEKPEKPDWQLQQAAFEGAGWSLPGEKRLIGMSLREIQRFARTRALKLKVHGSGWVRRYRPSSLATLHSGDILEVWLDE